MVWVLLWAISVRVWWIKVMFRYTFALRTNLNRANVYLPVYKAKAKSLHGLETIIKKKLIIRVEVPWRDVRRS